MQESERFPDVVAAITGKNVFPRFYAFLDEQINDRGAVALEKVVHIIERECRGEIYFHRPSMCSLLYWGELGLITIRDIAIKNPTHKNVSASLTILSCLAAGRSLSQLVVFNFFDDDFVARLNQFLSTANLKNYAKRTLTELATKLPSDDLLLATNTAFMSAMEPGPILHEGSIKEVISAISGKWLHFGPAALDEFKLLIDSQPLNESAFHELFIKYPQLLDPMAMKVWSKPALHGAQIPDFLIRRIDNTYLVVEIECPAKQLITKRHQLASETIQAEKQVTEYQEFLNDRTKQMQNHFPFIRDPDGLVIVGNEGALNEQQQEALMRANNLRHKVKIVGFDWILERSRNIYSNLFSMEIEVESDYRVF